jgi:transcription elongation factor GreA
MARFRSRSRNGAAAPWRLLRRHRTIRGVRLYSDEKERDMSATPNQEERLLITARGYERLSRELDRLQEEERRRLAGLLHEARGDGGLEDNPTLIDLLDERAQLEGRIATLEGRLAAAEIAPPPSNGRAAIGSVVRMRDVARGDILEYELVGPLEGDPADGRISVAAPIGRALVGQRRGARIEVETPRGPVVLEVTAVRPAPHARASEAA